MRPSLPPPAEPAELLNLAIQINRLCNKNMHGPDCISPAVCSGICCRLEIDIPNALASEYLRLNVIQPDQITEGNIFAFRLKINPENSKCCFYDPKLNGCSLHSRDIKPAQCCLFPLKWPEKRNGLLVQYCPKNLEFSADMATWGEVERLWAQYFQGCRKEYAFRQQKLSANPQ